MTHTFYLVIWLTLGIVVCCAIAVGFWLYRASLTWPTAEGEITRLDIERKRGSATDGGHYFSATFTYAFRGPSDERICGSWYKNFSNEDGAKAFAALELPIGKRVVVRFNPRNPGMNDLELDSWTYTGDRPASFDI